MSKPRRCACKRTTDAGWSSVSGGHHSECLICRTEREQSALDLRHHRPTRHRREIACRCCGRKGKAAADGLIRMCYMWEYRKRPR